MFANIVNIKLGEFYEANAFKNYEFSCTRESSSKIIKQFAIFVHMLLSQIQML